MTRDVLGNLPVVAPAYCFAYIEAQNQPTYTLQHTATHYNILQHPAPCCNTRASLSSPLRIDSHANEARNQPTHTATLCNTLQHTSLLVVALAYWFAYNQVRKLQTDTHTNTYLFTRKFSAIEPHQKLHRGGVTTPLPFFCLICAIRSEQNGILAFTNDGSFGSRMSKEAVRKQRDQNPLITKNWHTHTHHKVAEPHRMPERKSRFPQISH